MEGGLFDLMFLTGHGALDSTYRNSIVTFFDVIVTKIALGSLNAGFIVSLVKRIIITP